MIKNSVLYQLTTDTNAPSYILGTMHVKDKIAFTHLEKALGVMKNCSHFYAEMDLDLAAELINPTDYLIPDEKTLHEMIRPHQYERMQKILSKSFHFDLEQWIRFYPMIIINQLTEKILNEDHALPLDSHLWSEAKANSMVMGGLETVEEQISTLKTLDFDIQLKMLKDLCRNVSAFRSKISQLVEKYQKGDITSIYKLSKHGLATLKQPLLYFRNVKMAQRIEKSIENPSFFAVGAAHLAGAKGVLSLLKQKEIKVKAL